MAGDHRLVIGVGSAGTSHLLDRWVAEFEAGGGGPVVRIRGRRHRPLDPEDLPALDGATLVVVDGVEGLGPEAVELVARAAERGTTTWAARRPWPVTTATHWLDDVISLDRPAVRVGPSEADEIAQALAAAADRAVSSDVVERLAAASGGLTGWAVRAFAAGWEGDGDLPPDLADQIVRVVAGAGSGAGTLSCLACLAPEVELTRLSMASSLGSATQIDRAVEAAGLFVDGRIVPLVARAVEATMSPVERRTAHDDLADLLADHDPVAALEHALAGSGDVSRFGPQLVEAADRLVTTDPDGALDLLATARRAGVDEPDVAAVEARVLLWLGRGEAREVAARAGDQASALLAAVDLRAGRWAGAAGREGPASVLGRLALARLEETRAEPMAFDDVWAGAVGGVLATLEGDAAGVARVVGAADDYARLDAPPVLGLTPHLVGWGTLLLTGDRSAATLLADDAVEAAAGGPGEAPVAALVAAYDAADRSDYGPALALAEPSADAAPRETFLWAALQALLARRSGDVARLRAAWGSVHRALVRSEPSWLLWDPLTQLLTSGARLDEPDLARRLAEGLGEQLARLGPAGTVQAARLLVDLEIEAAIRTESAAEPASVIRSAAVRLRDLDGHDARLWVGWAEAWAEVLEALDEERALDSAIVEAAVDALVEAGERWEASRLAGRAGLAAQDAGEARRWLEQARSLHGEVPTAGGGDRLGDLGLSDREVDVARLVVDGLTYKDIGGRLFISPKTVEHHVARIRAKLGAESRAELITIVRDALGGGGADS